MLTIASGVFTEAVVKKSRFIAAVEPAASEDAARHVIASARASNAGAGHHCSAFVIGDGTGSRIERSSDDGEPSGTAGGPMLEVLTGRNLTNVVAVVSRYFGGIKLGTGGLARAYSGAVATALEQASFLQRVRRELVRVELDHSDAGRIESELRGRGVDVVSVEYLVNAVVTLAVDDVDDVSALLAGLTSGVAEPERIGTRYVEVPA